MIKHLYHAFFYSLAGIRAAFRDEPAFRLEIILSIVLIPAAFFMSPEWLERALLIGVVLLVMVVELLNSAIEAAIDRISEERHPLSKKAKDCGSAAVLVACVIALVVWGGVLLG